MANPVQGSVGKNSQDYTPVFSEVRDVSAFFRKAVQWMTSSDEGAHNDKEETMQALRGARIITGALLVALKVFSQRKS